MIPEATVLEALQDAGIAHAAVCGGRGRCTTCRVVVTQGADKLPPPSLDESKALGRVASSDECRLACQIRPTSDLTIVPILPAGAGAAAGHLRGSLAGSEKLVTVVFLDIRGFTTLGESRLPYDVLFILNQFFVEMTEALDATGGHYSQFTGDGLMALYGHDSPSAANSARQAVLGAAQMMTRLDSLNNRLMGDLLNPLQMGIGIHFGEAIVGAMGPPKSQIISAIGDTVNTTARLEGLTKEFGCRLILSKPLVDVAGFDIGSAPLHRIQVKGKAEHIEFYALNGAPIPEP